jgi:molybdenum cofactor sulfurtransferase
LTITAKDWALAVKSNITVEMETNTIPDDPSQYDCYIEHMRKTEYPMLKDQLYLDHAGTTIYSKTLMDRFHAAMMSNLLGNPHSGSPSSQQSTHMVDSVRTDLLKWFNAGPESFDLIFTANATAAIKLVMEAFRAQSGGFWYGYHIDSHTSLVGVRECAKSHRCLESDKAVEQWLSYPKDTALDALPKLFAYPAQSNMDGKRLPLWWSRSIRGNQRNAYTLLDAAAYASTSPLDLSDLEVSPDFTVLSLNKMFGFPDLGALIVRKDAGHLFRKRQYFGGGTVDMVLCLKEQWHASKSGALHEQLEDGTLPIHSILALQNAMQTHHELFGPRLRIAKHTARLAQHLHKGLLALKHSNGTDVCKVYTSLPPNYEDMGLQGPIIAFNLKDHKGDWVSNAEVEKLAAIKNIHLRVGGVCNPGGIAQALDIEPWEMRENFSAGHRCNSEDDVINGKPTGIIRISFGAMSTKLDVVRFLEFIEEFFVYKSLAQDPPRSLTSSPINGRLHVESLTVYPIKSCAGWQVPYGSSWQIRNEGLVWDREWCIVHGSTGKALSQKQHPRMALIRPHLDFRAGMLRIHAPGCSGSIVVPLSNDPSYFETSDFSIRDATVCGDPIKARLYTSPAIAEFLTKALGVSCTLARFPAVSAASMSARHSKTHLARGAKTSNTPRTLLLSNESPILTISRSSLNRLNEQIKAKGGKAAHPSVFRPNIVLSESIHLPPGQEQPWAEDEWYAMQVGGHDGPVLDFLGGCRRCQMVCIDQVSGEKNQEPFVTLAKTRRFDGKVLFGVHTALVSGQSSGKAVIKVGDEVETLR